MADGKSSVTKSYPNNLIINMAVKEVPDTSFMFFGEFTFTSNIGLSGTGRFAKFVILTTTMFEYYKVIAFHFRSFGQA